MTTNYSVRRSRSSGSLFKSVLGLILTLPLIIIIVGALGIAFEAALENLRYTKATDQILSIVVAAHNYALGQTSFAQQVGDDLIDNLVRAGQIVPPEGAVKPGTFYNPWFGEVHGVVSAPSILRIESVLPTRDCRRIATFLIKTASNFGLSRVEVKDNNTDWHVVFQDTDAAPASQTAVEQACGESQRATLATLFRVR